MVASLMAGRYGGITGYPVIMVVVNVMQAPTTKAEVILVDKKFVACIRSFELQKCIHGLQRIFTDFCKD
jgi:hypothetical protein